MRRPAGGVCAPIGFSASAARAGIRQGTTGDDLALVASGRPAVAAGVFTSNRIKAAPVVWSSRVVASGRSVRAVLLNSGNANACTGRPGDAAVRRCAAKAARLLGAPRAGEVLVASTGVIGEPLPASRLLAALPELVAALARGARAAARAARAIMTTDTRPKQSAAAVRAAGHDYTVGGMAKGAGMIHPQMATMLCVMTTDAPLSRASAARLLRAAVERSFNAITVDGDTSTNDCVILLANGAARGRVAPGGPAERAVGAAIERVARDLASQVAADAEGARKLMTVTVRGARDERSARLVARTIASSMLVKTAVHGGDPNWGRILAAAGRSGVALRPADLRLAIGGHIVLAGGRPRPSARKAAARHLRRRRVTLDLTIGGGRAEGTALGSDLTARYVAINAHYRT